MPAQPRPDALPADRCVVRTAQQLAFALPAGGAATVEIDTSRL